MKCHEVDYEIFGDDMQIVEIELDPSETVIAKAGAMNYLEDGISFETKMGDGSKPVGGILDSLMHVGKRVLTGDSIEKKQTTLTFCPIHNICNTHCPHLSHYFLPFLNTIKGWYCNATLLITFTVFKNCHYKSSFNL